MYEQLKRNTMNNQHNQRFKHYKLKTIWGLGKGVAVAFLIFFVFTMVRAQTESHKPLPSAQPDTTVQTNKPFPGFTGVFLDSYRKNGQVVYVTYNSRSSPVVQLKPTVIYGHVLMMENVNAEYNEKINYGKSKTVEPDMNELRINMLSDTGVSMLKPNPANDFVIVEWKLPETAGVPWLYIHSVKGVFVNKIRLNGHQNQKVLSTTNLKPGAYLFSLVSDGTKYDSRKLTVIK